MKTFEDVGVEWVYFANEKRKFGKPQNRLLCDEQQPPPHRKNLSPLKPSRWDLVGRIDPSLEGGNPKSNTGKEGH